MLYARTTLRARAALATPRILTSTLPRALPSQWMRLNSDSAGSGRPKPGHRAINPMIRPPLSFSELQYDPKKSFQTSSNHAKDSESRTRDEAQEEVEGVFNREASPSKNTRPEAQSVPPRTTPLEEASADFKPEQPEVDDTISAGINAAESQPKEASESSDQPRIQLPDLRQGIPSTFSEEFLKQTKPVEPEPTQEKAHHEIDITEEHTRTAGGTGRGRGGSGEDDLPKSAYETSIDKRRNQIASYMYITFGLFGIVGAVYLGRDWDTEEEEKAHPDAPSGWDFRLFWNRIKARTSTSLGYYTEPTFPKLLPNMDPPPPYTLVISLEDLMIHSEWTRQHGWRTAKRPGLDYFLRYLSQYYEIVLFTTMPAASADQIIRKLDPYHFIMWPLFREATRYEGGEYIKDLSYLNRPLSKVILLDTRAAHAKNQPENAIILPPWTGDPHDAELVGYIPFLEYVATMGVADVRAALASFSGTHIPTEYARREALLREQLARDVGAAKPRFSIGAAIARALGIKPQGGLVTDDGKSVGEGLAEGKMLQDQIRERGLRQYEALEREIREKGEAWLREEKELEAKMQADQMKSMKTSFFGIWGGAAQGGARQAQEGEKKGGAAEP